MTFDPSIGGTNARSDSSLRKVSHAIAAATSVLDPDLVPQHAVDAIVRRLGARRADLWRFDGRRTLHVAGAGVEIDIPTSLPSSITRIARGGISQSFAADELGMGVGVRWRHLLFGTDSASIQTLALVAGEACLGCLTIVSETPAAHGIDETFSIFAHQVASAMQHAELHRAAQDAALAMRLQNRNFLAFVGARGKPDGAIRAPVPLEVRRMFDSAGRHAQIELQVADHGQSRFAGTQRAQPVAVRYRLRGDEIRTADRAPHQWLDRPVTS